MSPATGDVVGRTAIGADDAYRTLDGTMTNATEVGRGDG
jgi:hypothetical protein